ncbi:NAD(P)-binding domain-containing protein [Streptococcus iniae]|nr:NAD(P)-binding domain-containing protein [Streptococcus iniae]
MKVGFIGVGKMASAIINGLKQTDHDIIISGSSLSRSKEIADNLQVAYANSHQELIDQTDFIILGIKPQVFETILKPLTFKQPVMSMAAGLKLRANQSDCWRSFATISYHAKHECANSAKHDSYQLQRTGRSCTLCFC